MVFEVSVRMTENIKILKNYKMEISILNRNSKYQGLSLVHIIVFPIFGFVIFQIKQINRC